MGQLAEAGMQHEHPERGGPSERPAAFAHSATWMPEDTHGRRAHGHGELVIGPPVSIWLLLRAQRELRAKLAGGLAIWCFVRP